MRAAPPDVPRPPKWLSYLILAGVVGLVLARAQGVVAWGQFALIWIVGSAVLFLWALLRYRDRRQ
jgi:dolichyl-phosphate-mannose--protein O-mannosyl transferase